MNYKIRVENEAESKEVQELFFELGASLGNGDKHAVLVQSIVGLAVIDDLINFIFNDVVFADIKQCEELTIPQLRDLVVLKRNDVGDKTHTDLNNYDWYLDSSGKFYRHQGGIWVYQPFLDINYLEPIEKPMKEYLNKLTDGTYKLVVLSDVIDGHDGLIEVPEGALFAYETGSTGLLFTRNKRDAYNGFLVWQRKTLNDQVTSAEMARQEFIDGLPAFNFGAVDDFVESNVEQDVKHSHYKKDISHLDTLDIYRVTELFNPHSCGAHIAKKALCSGQRGHKDLLTDIQDIIDTAERWKEMLIEDGNS